MGICFEALTAEERTAITKRIEHHGQFCNNGESVMTENLEHILRFWDEEKTSLFYAFGKKLILEREVNLERSIDELSRNMYNNLANVMAEFRDFIFSKLPSRRDDYELFLDQENAIYKLTDCELLVDNIYKGQTISFTNNDKTYVLREGCKMIRALTKLLNMYGYNHPEIIEEMRTAHSMVLNDRYFKGTLCLSIHPLDYFTMSDNNCNWESCMAWSTYRGEYRQGTVEMMNSPYMVLAYVKASKPMTLHESGIEWSNKRWRQLYIVSPEIIMGIKQYPYYNPHIETCVLNWLKQLCETNTFNYGKYYGNEPYAFQKFSNRIDLPNGAKDVSISFEMHHMYNDISYYESFGYFAEGLESGATIHMYLSGVTECLFCGKDCSDEYEEDFEPSFVGCVECLEVIRCVDCGDWIHRADSYSMNGDKYCEYCYENNMSHCEHCESVVSEHDCITVSFNHPKWEWSETRHFCSYCFDDATEKIADDLVRDGYGYYSIAMDKLSEDLMNEVIELFDLDPVWT